jgi:hypothetical protein
MPSLELRQRALELAVDARQLNDAPGSIVAVAEKFLNFLEGTAREAAKEGLAAADATVTEKPKKPRGKPMQNEEVSFNAIIAACVAAPTVEPEPVGAQIFTLDDVRNALVQLQTRKSREASLEILAKYTKPAAATTGNLKPEQYGKLIAELNAA